MTVIGNGGCMCMTSCMAMAQIVFDFSDWSFVVSALCRSVVDCPMCVCCSCWWRKPASRNKQQYKHTINQLNYYPVSIKASMQICWCSLFPRSYTIHSDDANAAMLINYSVWLGYKYNMICVRTKNWTKLHYTIYATRRWCYLHACTCVV